MKRIVLVGGGFAGLHALGRLAGAGLDLRITLIDRRATSDFLPMLPDLIGRPVRPRRLRYPLAPACERHGARFLQATVEGIDLDARTVHLPDRDLPFDYLLLASGSETTFHGHDELRAASLTLDDVADAVRMCDSLDGGGVERVVVVGGGYTGVEIATNVWRRQRGSRSERRVAIVEYTDTLLPGLPEEFRLYTRANVRRLGIETVTGTTVESVDAGTVICTNGRRFERALVLWSAGVQTGDFVRDLPVDRTRQGRIEVDEFLGFAPGCFAAGDVAGARRGGQPLRMGVQFSIAGGLCAAGNILHSLRGEEPDPFRPFDPGYVIPMANGRSCGRILGIECYGAVPTGMHYLMCLVRTFSWADRLGLARDLGRV